MQPAWSSVTPETVRIRRLQDVHRAQSMARWMARYLGFNVRAQWEIAIAANEAAQHLLGQGGGEMTFGGLAPDRPGLVFEARGRVLRHGGAETSWAELMGDKGITNLADFRRRRHSGLPAIRRLMDQVNFRSRPEGGSSLMAVKYLFRD